MKILKTASELKEYRASVNGSLVALVPTMGALHAGHASLIKKASDEAHAVIVSVFVNPTQFLPNEDFESYPRSEESDIKMAELAGATAIFMPSVDEIYSETEPKILAPSPLASILEGATRPGHFDGVCTVLTKLFNLARPTHAYFGKKDAQQLIIVQNLVKTLFMDTKIVPCEIIREADGLALSSRNKYLDENELVEALKISRSLMKASNMIKAGELNSKTIISAMKEALEPLKVDYVAIVNREDLEPLENIKLNETLILVAASVGKTRLIDNLWV